MLLRLTSFFCTRDRVHQKQLVQTCDTELVEFRLVSVLVFVKPVKLVWAGSLLKELTLLRETSKITSKVSTAFKKNAAWSFL